MMTEHASITVQRDMLAIAHMWPALLLRLAGGGTQDSSGVRSKPASRPPIDLHVSDTIAEITSWAYYLARTLRDEVIVERWRGIPYRADQVAAEPWAPVDPTMPAMLEEIARWRVGHFTEHPDEMLALAIADDAHDYAHRLRSLLWPTGARRVDLRIPCLDHGTSDQGERIVCTGHYWTLLAPGRPLSDMVCSEDDTHRMTPAAWQSAQRHGKLDRAAVERLLGVSLQVGGS